MNHGSSKTGTYILVGVLGLWQTITAGGGEPPRGLQSRQRLSEYPRPHAYYHLWVPPAYSADKPQPLFLMLHGGHLGQGDADAILAFHKSIPALRNNIVVFPNHLFWFWSHPEESAYVMTILEKVMSQYNVDPKRIYVIGASMGGNGAMHFAAQFPEMFAATAAMSCWTQYIPVEKAAVMPIFLAHGKKDRIVPLSDAHDTRRRLNLARNVQLTYHEGDYGHQAPQAIMVQAAEWLLQHENPRTFDIRTMKQRAARLPVPQWMRNKNYEANYHGYQALALLTTREKKYQNPQEALVLAEKANLASGGKNPQILRTLAMAYFANNRARDAVRIQRQAIARLDKKTPAKVRKEQEQLLKVYEEAEKKR